MKNVFIVALVSIPVIACAQQDSSAVSLPIKNRIVFYEKEYQDNTVSKDERFDRALKWFASAFPDSREALNVSDKKAGKISGTGIFRVVTGDAGSSRPAREEAYYWVKFVVAISVTEDRCTVQAYDYYEKPNSGLAPISKRSPADRADLRRLAPADFHLPICLSGLSISAKRRDHGGLWCANNAKLRHNCSDLGEFLRKSA